jgi:hypothetical protein
MTFMQSTSLWAFVFVLIGANAYVVDRKIGIKVCGKWRKMTSPVQDAPGVVRGFIYNRTNHVRWFWASIISTIQAFIMIGWRHEDPRMELVVWFVITPATMIGFLLGPLYFRFKERKEEFLKTLDRVESGQIDVTERMSAAARQKLGLIEKMFSGIVDWFATRIASKRHAKEKIKEEAPTEEIKVDRAMEEARAREILKKFTA